MRSVRRSNTAPASLVMGTVVPKPARAERPVADPPKEISPKRKAESKWRNEKASIISSGRQHGTRWLWDCSIPKRRHGQRDQCCCADERGGRSEEHTCG